MTKPARVFCLCLFVSLVSASLPLDHTSTTLESTENTALVPVIPDGGLLRGVPSPPVSIHLTGISSAPYLARNGGIRWRLRWELLPMGTCPRPRANPLCNWGWFLSLFPLPSPGLHRTRDSLASHLSSPSFQLPSPSFSSPEIFILPRVRKTCLCIITRSCPESPKDVLSSPAPVVWNRTAL